MAATCIRMAAEDHARAADRSSRAETLSLLARRVQDADPRSSENADDLAGLLRDVQHLAAGEQRYADALHALAEGHTRLGAAWQDGGDHDAVTAVHTENHAAEEGLPTMGQRNALELGWQDVHSRAQALDISDA